MNVYNVYNLPIYHPKLQKKNHFHCSLEGEYFAPSPDDDYTTIPLGHDILTCGFKKDTMCQLDTALYYTDKINWCCYALFIKKAKYINLTVIMK